MAGVNYTLQNVSNTTSTNHNSLPAIAGMSMQDAANENSELGYGGSAIFTQQIVPNPGYELDHTNFTICGLEPNQESTLGGGWRAWNSNAFSGNWCLPEYVTQVRIYTPDSGTYGGLGTLISVYTDNGFIIPDDWEGGFDIVIDIDGDATPIQAIQQQASFNLTVELSNGYSSNAKILFAPSIPRYGSNSYIPSIVSGESLPYKKVINYQAGENATANATLGEWNGYGELNQVSLAQTPYIAFWIVPNDGYAVSRHNFNISTSNNASIPDVLPTMIFGDAEDQWGNTYTGILPYESQDALDNPITTIPIEGGSGINTYHSTASVVELTPYKIQYTNFLTSAGQSPNAITNWLQWNDPQLNPVSLYLINGIQNPNPEAFVPIGDSSGYTHHYGATSFRNALVSISGGFLEEMTNAVFPFILGNWNDVTNYDWMTYLQTDQGGSPNNLNFNNWGENTGIGITLFDLKGVNDTSPFTDFYDEVLSVTNFDDIGPTTVQSLADIGAYHYDWKDNGFATYETQTGEIPGEFCAIDFEDNMVGISLDGFNAFVPGTNPIDIHIYIEGSAMQIVPEEECVDFDITITG
jgi:hypothetical protein